MSFEKAMQLQRRARLRELLAPYDERAAAVDALAAQKPCLHGIWPHQGECPDCPGSGRVQAIRERVHQPFFDTLVRHAEPLPLAVRPFDEREAAVEAVQGQLPCPHGVWPHQGICEQCPLFPRSRDA